MISLKNTSWKRKSECEEGTLHNVVLSSLFRIFNWDWACKYKTHNWEKDSLLIYHCLASSKYLTSCLLKFCSRIRLRTTQTFSFSNAQLAFQMYPSHPPFFIHPSSSSLVQWPITWCIRYDSSPSWIIYLWNRLKWGLSYFVIKPFIISHCCFFYIRPGHETNLHRDGW